MTGICNFGLSLAAKPKMVTLRTMTLSKSLSPACVLFARPGTNPCSCLQIQSWKGLVILVLVLWAPWQHHSQRFLAVLPRAEGGTRITVQLWKRSLLPFAAPRLGSRLVLLTVAGDGCLFAVVNGNAEC